MTILLLACSDEAPSSTASANTGGNGDGENGGDVGGTCDSPDVDQQCVDACVAKGVSEQDCCEKYCDGKGDPDHGWSGAIDAKTGSGTYGFVDDKTKCEVSYVIESAKSAEDCDECFFAWEMTLGEAKVADSAGCNGADELVGAVLRAGQGKDKSSALYLDSGEGWPKGGTSLLKEAEWYFNHSESAAVLP
ncbi:hypothetical protein JYT22_00875 [Endomicrobium sp. AH-315-J14]|nr:hypothetical protein [Endomicrobium sp. AH-315-J14]